MKQPNTLDAGKRIGSLFEHGRRFPLAVIVTVVLIFAPHTHSVAQVTSSTSFLSRNEITFHLALALKTRADQSFLLGDTDAAQKLYSEAAMELANIESGWRAENAPLPALLERDISYRQTLLQYKVDFWGGVYSLSPINPVQAFISFEETVLELETLAERMEEEKQKIIKATALAAAIGAAREIAKTDVDVQALEKLTKEVQETFHIGRATTAENRIRNNVARQKEIAEERSQLSAQYDKVHRALDTLVVNSLLQATGIPPEAAALAQSDKPLEQRILQAGRILISSKNPQMTQAFAGLSETTAKIVDAAQKGSEALQDLQRIRSAGEAVQNALRRGTLEGALQAGSLIYEQLPASDRERLQSLVTTQLKPPIALMEAARFADETRKSIATIVANNDLMRDRLIDLLAERIGSNTEAFDVWYRGRLTEIFQSMPSKANIGVVEQAIRAWPFAFYSQFPDGMKETLRKLHGQVDDAAAAKEIFSVWPPKGVSVSLIDGSVIVTAGAQKHAVPLQKFVSSQAMKSVEIVANNVDRVGGEEKLARQATEQHLIQMVRAASTDRELFVTNFAASIHELDEASSLARVLPSQLLDQTRPFPKVNSDKVFDEIWQKMPTTAREIAARNLGAMQAGSYVGKEATNSPSRTTVRPEVKGDTGRQANVNEAVLKAAIATAFPAAAVAFAVVDAVAAMSEMSKLAAQINELSAEDRSIMKEQLSLYDLVRDERHAAAIAEIGNRIASTRRDGAYRQIDRYQIATDSLDSGIERGRVAQRLFMPRAFLLSELLRSRFDRLDRSLAFWTGDPTAPRGQIAKFITTDPQWLRYALDPELQVYRWLDRGGESDRGDLRKLSEEWRRKLVLARSVCDVLNCRKETAVVGEVTSRQISLKAVSPKQWKRFEAWKNGGRGDFSFEFLLTPEVLRPDRALHLLRFIDVRAGIVRANKDIVDPAGSALFHPGAAFVPVDDGFVKEHYLPKIAVNPTWAPFPALRTRWASSFALRPLEGYGVYTLWRFTLQDNLHNRQADDVLLDIAYQYQPKLRVLSDEALEVQRRRVDQWGIHFVTSDGLELRVPLSEVPYFAKEEEGRALLEELQKDSALLRVGIPNFRMKKIEGRVR